MTDPYMAGSHKAICAETGSIIKRRGEHSWARVIVTNNMGQAGMR